MLSVCQVIFVPGISIEGDTHRIFVESARDEFALLGLFAMCAQ